MARRKAAPLVITCAGCNNTGSGGNCRCNLKSGFDGSIALIRAVARGEKTPAECQEWLDREQVIEDQHWRQQDQDEAEFHRAVDALMARTGTSSHGPSYALHYLMGMGGWALCRGTDDEVYMQIRRLGEVPVRLEHIRWAREWVRDQWLRGDTAKTLRRWGREAIRRRIQRQFSTVSSRAARKAGGR